MEFCGSRPSIIDTGLTLVRVVRMRVTEQYCPVKTRVGLRKYKDYSHCGASALYQHHRHPADYVRLLIQIVSLFYSLWDIEPKRFPEPPDHTD